MHDENHNAVARTPVKKDNQPVHQQLRARRFLGSDAHDATLADAVATASTPVDPIKTRPVRRHVEDLHRGPAGVDLKKAFIDEQLHLFESPKVVSYQIPVVRKQVSSVELQPVAASVRQSDEMVMMEGPSSPGDSTNSPLILTNRMRMSEEVGEAALREAECMTDRSADVLCEADTTPARGANEAPSQTSADAVAVAPTTAAAATVTPPPPPAPSSDLPSGADEEDEDDDDANGHDGNGTASESGYGSVRSPADVSALRDVNVTPQRQCTSAARSAPSPSLDIDLEFGVVPKVVACTPVKAASTALFTTTNDDEGSSNACRPLSSSFGIRPKATKRFDFVKGYEPLPVTPEKTAPRFSRGSAVEYQLVRSASANAAYSAKVNGTGSKVTMREERWNDPSPTDSTSPAAPLPLPPSAADGSRVFQRGSAAVALTSQQSSTEERAPRRMMRQCERRDSALRVRETSPTSRAKAATMAASEPLEMNTDLPATATTKASSAVFSSEEGSPASPHALSAGSSQTSRRRTSELNPKSSGKLSSEASEDFGQFRKRSFRVYADRDIYDATNNAFKDGISRATMPRSAMPYDRASARHHHHHDSPDSSDDDTSSSCDSDTTDASEDDTHGAVAASQQADADSSPSHTLLPGVDSTCMSSLSNGKRPDSAGRPTTAEGVTTRGVSSSNGCTTDERGSRSTSREYEEDEDGPHRVSPNAQSDPPQAACAAATPVGARCLAQRPPHAFCRLGLAADDDDDDDDNEDANLGFDDNPFEMPLHHSDVVELSAITIESLDEDAAVASKSYENFLAVTTPSCALILDRGQRRGSLDDTKLPDSASHARQQSAFARCVTALLEEAASQYEALLAEHREDLLTDFLTLTERCIHEQRQAKERKKAAIFGFHDALPLAIALPTAEPEAHGTPENYTSMEKLRPASPYVCTATTCFGMAPRLSRPSSALRSSRRGSADASNTSAPDAVPPSPLVPPKVLPKLCPIAGGAVGVLYSELDAPLQNPLQVILNLSLADSYGEHETTMTALLDVYVEYYVQEHLRAVQHALFDVMYYVMVAIPGTRLLETHERRLICMSRDLLIRDRIELFMLTLPRGVRAGSGSRTGGAIKIPSGKSDSGAHTGGLMSGFRSAYEASKAKTLTSYHQEKERLVVQWGGASAAAANSNSHDRASSVTTPVTRLCAVEEYRAGSGARPASAGVGGGDAPSRRASSLSSVSRRAMLSASASAPRQVPSPAQLAAARKVRTRSAGPASPTATAAPTPAVASEDAPTTPTTTTTTTPTDATAAQAAALSSTWTMMLGGQRRTASLPNIPTTQPPASSTAAPTEGRSSRPSRPLLTVTRGGPRKNKEGDATTYRRTSGEYTLIDGTQRLRAKERIQPILRQRTPPPPPSEDQFMNLAELDPR